MLKNAVSTIAPSSSLMKRDMDLIRLLLEQIETGEGRPELADYDEDTQVYHLALLIEAGYMRGYTVENERGETVSVSIIRLTWAGHEFLDAVRDDTVWAKAKSVVKTSATSATAEVLKETCQRLLTAGIEAALRAGQS